MVKTQLTLDSFERQSFLTTLNPLQIKIIQHLESGYYAAIVARRLNVSSSYVSRFVNKLLELKLISVSYKDPLFRRAIVYSVSKELSTHTKRLERKDESAFTLLTPHNVRYKKKILSQTNKIQTNISRFAHARFKHIRTYNPRGGERYVFEMTGVHGRIRMIVHPSSIEALVVDRHHIPARSEQEATNILSMALQDAYARFIDEQRWCGCRIELGEPVIVGSVHYAFKSKILKDEFVRKGQTKLKITDTLEIDNSPEDHADLVHAELETPIRSEAVRFDESLRMVPKVMDDLQSVKDSILGMNTQADKINVMYNNVQALCQSGLPMQNQFNQLTGVVARQGETIALIQETMLELVKNMSKILAKMDIK